MTTNIHTLKHSYGISGKTLDLLLYLTSKEVIPYVIVFTSSELNAKRIKVREFDIFEAIECIDEFRTEKLGSTNITAKRMVKKCEHAMDELQHRF